MAGVLLRARAVVVIARDVLYLDDPGHTLYNLSWMIVSYIFTLNSVHRYLK